MRDSQLIVKVLSDHQFVGDGPLCRCGRPFPTDERMACHQADLIQVALFKADERREQVREYATATVAC